MVDMHSFMKNKYQELCQLTDGMVIDLKKYHAKPDKTLYQHTYEVLVCAETLSQLGYIKDDKIIKLLYSACYYHDFGKMNDAFQSRVMSENNKIKFDNNTEVQHNVLSMYFIDRSQFSEEITYFILLNAVANHHNYGDVFEIMDKKHELVQHFLEKFQQYTYSLNKSCGNKIAKYVEDNDTILVKGLLQRCDYSASANSIVEYPNDFLENALESFCQKLISDKKSEGWNPLQEFCKEHFEDNIIALADTGMGKTEAVLLWTKNVKAFYILPVRTSINAMYIRLREKLLNNDKIEERLGLLHSESLEFSIEQYKEDDFLQQQYELTRRYSMPLTITTLDQIFDFVFKYEGYELKLATLSYSKIIIDEIQMYGPDLLAYLIFGIEYIHKMGGKIGIVTATLYPFVKDYITSKVPFQFATFVNDKESRHNVAVKEVEIQVEDIFSHYVEQRKKSLPNKILVICNTVKKAQEIYSELKEMLKTVKGSSDSINDLHILHSRFTRKERADKEAEILKCGETYVRDDILDIQNAIWVTTSLVEASLDIDFDYLFTELQDLASLFQRFGRCNRKGVKLIDQVNCFVYTEINPFLIGKNGFIDERIYTLSKNALLKHCKKDGILTEVKKRKIIDEEFTSEKMKGSDFGNKYNHIYSEISNIRVHDMEKCDIDLRNIQSVDVIPASIFEDNKEELLNAVNKLKDPNLKFIEKREIQYGIKKFTVSVQNFVLNNYNKNLAKGNVEASAPLTLNQYNKIPIIPCHYDDCGFSAYKSNEYKMESVWW